MCWKRDDIGTIVLDISMAKESLRPVWSKLKTQRHTLFRGTYECGQPATDTSIENDIHTSEVVDRLAYHCQRHLEDVPSTRSPLLG